MKVKDVLVPCYVQLQRRKIIPMHESFLSVKGTNL